MKFILSLILFSVLLIPVYAANAVLSGVEVSGGDGVYTIILDIKSINYKKIIKDNNNITIELKNVVQADEVKTSYLNAPSIESVTVQTFGNKTSLNITGKGVAGAQIEFSQNPGSVNSIYKGKKSLPFDPVFAFGALLIFLSAFLLKKTFTYVPKKELEIPAVKAKSPMYVPKVVSYKRAVKSPYSTNAIDSIKFLETVTEIYENNGRKDLAKNVKSGMDKAKIAI